MICTKCNTEITDGKNFCANCGSPAPQAVPQTAPVPQTVSQFVQQATTAPQAVPTPQYAPPVSAAPQYAPPAPPSPPQPQYAPPPPPPQYTPPTPAQYPPPPQQQYTPPMPPPYPPPTSGKKSGGKVAIIVTAIFVFLLGVTIGGHFLNFYTLPFLPQKANQGENNPENEPDKISSGDLETPTSGESVPNGLNTPAQGLPRDDEARQYALSEQWKQTVYATVRRFHDDLALSIPQKLEQFGEYWESDRYVYSVSLYDAGYDAPYLIISDEAYDFMMGLDVLYHISDGWVWEIVSAQRIDPYVNTVTGERDLLSATWHSGGTYSETYYYKYTDGWWQQQSYYYITGGGQFFYDDDTGEFGEGFEEAERLLQERLKDYEPLVYEANVIRTIRFGYVDSNGEPVAWEQIENQLIAYLNAYDGIEVNLP